MEIPGSGATYYAINFTNGSSGVGPFYLVLAGPPSFASPEEESEAMYAAAEGMIPLAETTIGNSPAVTVASLNRYSLSDASIAPPE